MANHTNNEDQKHQTLLEVVEEAIIKSDQFSDDVVLGSDSDGRTYATIKEMWQAQGWTTTSSSDGGNGEEENSNNNDRREEWYERAAAYYEENCPATLDGVLGGFEHITQTDINGSKSFLDRNLSNRIDWTQGAACECGAGLGRVSKGLLLPLGVTSCHLVESSPRLLSEAPNYIGDPDASSRCKFICSGLESWMPASDTYTIIWIQWVLCYLTDEDIVKFLKRCGDALCSSGGIIVLKENTCTDEAFVVDTDDASVARSIPYLLKLCDEAGLYVVAQEMQDDFPDEIYPVPMIALDVMKNKKPLENSIEAK